MELDTQAIEHDLEEPYDPELFDRSSDGPKRVVLEPALEERVAGMSAEALITMAKIHERWARQLRVKARIMLADSNEPKENPMRELSIRELATN